MHHNRSRPLCVRGTEEARSGTSSGALRPPIMRCSNRKLLAYALVLLAALSLILQSDLLAFESKAPHHASNKKHSARWRSLMEHQKQQQQQQQQEAQAVEEKALPTLTPRSGTTIFAAAVARAAVVDSVNAIATSARGKGSVEPPAAAMRTAAAVVTPTSDSAVGELACPSVFVYNASQFSSKQLLDIGFGWPTGINEPWLFYSDQHNTGAVVLGRVLSSKRCQLVSDPKKASLFLVPLEFPPIRQATPEEIAKVWDFMPPTHEESLWHVCKRMYEEDWRHVLEHWSPQTARKHVFMPIHYFELDGFCRGAEPAYADCH